MSKFGDFLKGVGSAVSSGVQKLTGGTGSGGGLVGGAVKLLTGGAAATGIAGVLGLVGKGVSALFGKNATPVNIQTGPGGASVDIGVSAAGKNTTSQLTVWLPVILIVALILGIFAFVLGGRKRR